MTTQGPSFKSLPKLDAVGSSPARHRAWDDAPSQVKGVRKKSSEKGEDNATVGSLLY